MFTRKITSEGVILSRRNYQEADRILVVYTRHHGKISLLAKGVRKPKSRKRGHVEIFSQIRFSASKGKGIPILTEAEIMEYFPKIRTDLNRTSVCYFMTEVLNKLSQEDEKNEEIYEYLLVKLNELGESDNLRSFRNEYSRHLLTVLGFWPLGKELPDPDKFIEEISERKLSTNSVARKLLKG